MADGRRPRSDVAASEGTVPGLPGLGQEHFLFFPYTIGQLSLSARTCPAWIAPSIIMGAAIDRLSGLMQTMSMSH